MVFLWFSYGYQRVPGIAQASQVVLPLRQQRPLRHHAPQLAERRCGGAAVVLRRGGVQAAEEGGDLGPLSMEKPKDFIGFHRETWNFQQIYEELWWNMLIYVDLWWIMIVQW